MPLNKETKSPNLPFVPWIKKKSNLSILKNITDRFSVEKMKENFLEIIKHFPFVILVKTKQIIDHTSSNKFKYNYYCCSYN